MLSSQQTHRMLFSLYVKANEFPLMVDFEYVYVVNLLLQSNRENVGRMFDDVDSG